MKEPFYLRPLRHAKVGGVLIACLLSAKGLLAEDTPKEPVATGDSTAVAVAVEPAKREPDAIPLARVGDSTITLQQFMETVQADPNLYRTLGSMEERAKLLRKMIETRLLGLAALERAGLPRQGPLDELNNAVLKLEVQEFSPDEVTDEQVLQAYAARRESLGIPTAVRIREIYFSAPPNADQGVRDEARTKAGEALRRINAGESIEALAMELHYKPGLRSLGGDLGFVSVADYPQLATITATMQEGEVSGIIEYPSGFQILQFLGRREGILIPYEAAKDQLRKDLLEASRDSKRERFLHDYARKVGVEVLAPELSSAWSQPGVTPAAK